MGPHDAFRLNCLGELCQVKQHPLADLVVQKPKSTEDKSHIDQNRRREI
jgi:hypothetical protein